MNFGVRCSMSNLTDETLVLLERLKHHIATKRITQLQLAAATGVHQSQISRILAGHASRASGNLKKLCKYAESLSGVSSPAPPTSETSGALSRLVGHSRAERAAFARLLQCLDDWRATWVQLR